MKCGESCTRVQGLLPNGPGLTVVLFPHLTPIRLRVSHINQDIPSFSLPSQQVTCRRGAHVRSVGAAGPSCRLPQTKCGGGNLNQLQRFTIREVLIIVIFKVMISSHRGVSCPSLPPRHICGPWKSSIGVGVCIMLMDLRGTRRRECTVRPTIRRLQKV